MNLNEIIFIDNLPKIDLHGFDRDYAKVKVNEFINDNIVLKNEIIAIIHGNGTGVLKSEIHRFLERNKKVLEYKTFYNNSGTTLVKIDVN